MDDLQRNSLIVYLIKQLISKGSWCGETHIQKSAYLLQEMLGVPLGFKFVLYKHGPYSFELNDELHALEYDSFLLSIPQKYPYGPKISVDNRGEEILKQFSKTVEKFVHQIDYIIEKLGNKGVAYLERLATSFYITKDSPNTSVKHRAIQINRIKPHIPIEVAEEDIAAIETMINESSELRLVMA